MDSHGALSELVDLSSKTSTFVSIDVVDSTALKSGETEQDVIYTFLSYHKTIRELAYTYHGEIMSISGDGMMCRFERPDDAASAVQAVLNDLANFNNRHNRLSHRFAIRLGVNTGQVFESQAQTPGQLISHTIDVAAKLQQASAPNEARFSQETVSALKPNQFPLARIGWDAHLQTTAYRLASSQDAPTAERTLPNPVKTLVVEDDLGELMKLKKILFVKRHEPLPAYNSAQAALCTMNWQPHIILLSVDLPWDSGWELLKGLRADPQASHIPVILMAQQPTGEIVEKGFGWGANGLLKKPLEEQQIVKRIDMVLREFYL